MAQRSSQTMIGIDTGGTFTDFVLVKDGKITVHKEPTTPGNPAEAVLRGLSHLGIGQGPEIVHGSTVATNALLEHKGANAALVTTAGFEDVLEIGRQARAKIYDLGVSKPTPLIPRNNRLGVAERLGPTGEVIKPLDQKSIPDLLDRLRQLDVESVAICLLHSYANPEHEQFLAKALEPLGVFISTSHDVLPEFREYERCVATAVNASVGPVMTRYLSHLQRELGKTTVRIMQSNGGTLTVEGAGKHAVQTVLSGPAGGAVGAFELAKRAGFTNLITFDMGGTSTDVCLCPGEISRTTEATIGDIPLRLPVIDIHTVGAGGGSIAYKDPGGSLKVGPQSAGADPGPICYSRGGTQVTVTDANLFLGRLSAQNFLGGTQDLDTDTTAQAVENLAIEFDVPPEQIANGIIEVANATMERAIRVISLERGHDPRDFVLVCFGGAGGMHAVELARNLKIPKVLVPPDAGTLSALGMLMADFMRDYSKTILLQTDAVSEKTLKDTFESLENKAKLNFFEDNIPTEEIEFERSLDMRYVGQGFELSLPNTPDFASMFHVAHKQRYGYADESRPTEVVTARIRAVSRTKKPPLDSSANTGNGGPSSLEPAKQKMVFDGNPVDAPVIRRNNLSPGETTQGPALIIEYSTTTVIPPDWKLTVDDWHNLIIEPDE